VQGPVQGSHSGEGRAALGILDEQSPEHLELVGHARLHDGVVDVADHHIATALRRNEHLALRPNRERSFEAQTHAVPQTLRGQPIAGTKVDAKVAIRIRRDLLPGAAEFSGDDRPRNRTTRDASADVPQLIDQRILAGIAIGPGLAENAADHENLGSGPVAPVGLRHDAVLALRNANRPGDDLQDPGCRSAPPC
jgi:hypothetical protein